jgi:hypothetical protein
VRLEQALILARFEGVQNARKARFTAPITAIFISKRDTQTVEHLKNKGKTVEHYPALSLL